MIWFIIIAGIFTGELLLKNYIEKKLKEGENKKLLNGRLLVRKHYNRGSALNMGSGRQPLVAAVSLGMAVFCTVLFLASLGSKGGALLRAGLTLLLGGAYSNTYDRLKRKYVVDYFSFGVKWKRLQNIVFNISDFCILIGALLCILAMEKPPAIH